MDNSKECLKKSLTHDFKIIGIAVCVIFFVIIGALIGNASLPYINPLLTAYNVVILLSCITILFVLFVPFTCKTEDLKIFPTFVFMIMGYAFECMVFLFYSLAQCTYQDGVTRTCQQFPDVGLLALGVGILITIGCPISMAYARCR